MLWDQPFCREAVLFLMVKMNYCYDAGVCSSLGGYPFLRVSSINLLVYFIVFRVFCVTWNVNGRVPPSSLDPMIREFNIKGETESLVPDIYAVG